MASFTLVSRYKGEEDGQLSFTLVARYIGPQQPIGPHEDLLTIAKRRKLQWYRHVSRSSGLAKTILLGTVKGRRRQGRRKKRWEDNGREWTGLKFAKTKKTEENRENWL